MENYLLEAFQKLSLLEDDFNFSADRDVVDELKSFVADDVEEFPEEPVIDVTAESEQDLADNYVGKVILECECCHTRVYKDEAEVIVDEEQGLANIDEECPVCGNTMGYTVIGKIEKFEDTPAEEDDEIDFSDAETDPAEEEPVESLRERLKKRRALGESKCEEKCEGEECKEGCEGEECKEDMNALRRKFGGRVKKEGLDDGGRAEFGYTGKRKSLRGHGIGSINMERAEKGLPPLTSDEIDAVIDTQEKNAKWGRRGDESLGEATGMEALRRKFGGKSAKKEGLKEGWDDWDDDYDNECYVALNNFVDEVDPELLHDKIQSAGNEDKLAAWLCGRVFQDDYYEAEPEMSRACYDVAYKLMYGDDTDESLKEGWNDARKKLINRLVRYLAKYDYGTFGEMIKNGKFKNYTQLADYISSKVYGMSLKELQGPLHSKEQWEPVIDIAKEIFNDGLDNWLKKNESLKEGIENLSMDTDDTHVEMTSTEDGGATVTVTPKDGMSSDLGEFDDTELPLDDGDEEIVPLSDEEQEDILANEPEGEEEEDEFDFDEFEEEPEGEEEPVEGEGEEEEEEEVPEESLKSPKRTLIKEEVEDDIDIDDFDDASFNDLTESYLRKVYENVKTFKTTSIKDSGNKLVVEGIIKFKNNKVKASQFVFTEANEMKSGKVVLEGYNKTFSKEPKSFKVKGSLKNNRYVAEAMNYRYTARNLNEGKVERTKVQGRVRVNK